MRTNIIIRNFCCFNIQTRNIRGTIILLSVWAIFGSGERLSRNRSFVIGESRSTVGNLFSTNWPIVQISHRTAIAEWHGETRAGALIEDGRDRIRVCDGVTGSSGAKVKRVADPLQQRYEAHMGTWMPRRKCKRMYYNSLDSQKRIERNSLNIFSCNLYM